MERRKVLEILGEGGNIVFEEIILEKQVFYTICTSENLFDEKGLNRNTLSPMYNSFKQALEYCQYPIFALHPEYIDPTIWNKLSDHYMNYCEGKLPGEFNNEGWDKALGIKDTSHVVDELISLGLLKEQAFLLCDIMCQIKLDRNTEKEIDAMLNDPMPFEGGGPGVREIVLLLAKEIRG